MIMLIEQICYSLKLNTDSSVNSKQERLGISFQLALFSFSVNYRIKVVSWKSPAPSLL